MSLNTALAISLGVLGAVATWLFLGPLGGMLAIWAAFIAWGCYYHSGGKEAGLQSTILGTAAGAVIAGITLVVASASFGASLPANMWVALCVGLGVAAMVLLANVPLFANIPAQVYGFAATVAMALAACDSWQRDRSLDGQPRCHHHPVDDRRRHLRLRVGESCRHAHGGWRPSGGGEGLASRQERKRSRADVLASGPLAPARPRLLCE